MNDVNDATLRARLEILTEGLWVRDGVIYRTLDMQGHGSDIDEVVCKDEFSAKYARQVAAFRLLAILRPLCKTGRPHRMRDVPAHRACADCGFGAK